MVYFEQILHTYMYTFLHCLDTGKHIGDAALPGISPADRDSLVKKLLTLVPHDLF